MIKFEFRCKGEHFFDIIALLSDSIENTMVCNGEVPVSPGSTATAKSTPEFAFTSSLSISTS